MRCLISRLIQYDITTHRRGDAVVRSMAISGPGNLMDNIKRSRAITYLYFVS